MSSGIEVYFTRPNRPWSNDEVDFFRINVYSPTGAERVGVPAPNGRCSIDIPPGRYLVTATYGGIYVNFDSNETLVNVGCNQRPCVTIIPKSLHYCIWWTYIAMQQIAKNKALAPNLADLAGGFEPMLLKAAEAIPAEHRMLEFTQEAAKHIGRDADAC